MRDGFVRKDRSSYYLTPKKYEYDRQHYEQITRIRRQEMEQMKGLANTRSCYSRYIVSCPDDHEARDCGHCTNCLGRKLLPDGVSPAFLHRAEGYVNGLVIPIEPRKMWVGSQTVKGGKIIHVNQPGFCICRYGDSGYGELVKRGKYSAERRFPDELLGKCVSMLQPFVRENGITHICFVPSQRSTLVRDFAQRVVAALRLGFLDVLEKTHSQQQKEMENSAHQCANAYQAFRIRAGAAVPRNVLLMDDLVDSRWTLTVCGYRLMEAGAEKIYPFALADSSNRED